MNIDKDIKTVLASQEVNIEQLTNTNSIYKVGTYKISKEFKNTSDREIEQWANNILTILNTCKDINNNCECDFRICNDGNEKWNSGNLYVWVK